MADGDNMIIGRTNDESMPTIINRHGMGVVADALMVSNDTFGNAIRAGTSTGIGVDATTLSGTGLNASASTGVAVNASTTSGIVILATSPSGRSILARSSVGILSNADAFGLAGESKSSGGVLGITMHPLLRLAMPSGELWDGPITVQE